MGPVQSDIIGESIANAVKENKNEVRHPILATVNILTRITLMALPCCFRILRFTNA